MPGYSERELAYLAGIIDGEGSIYARWENRHGAKSRNNLALAVIVGNTDLRLINWLVENYGGRVTTYDRAKLGTRTLYSWKLSIRSNLVLCGAIRPYLLLKGEQLDLALELATLTSSEYRGKGRSVPQWNTDRRTELVTEIAALKKG